jgi:nucleoid-associated protein YgaU
MTATTARRGTVRLLGLAAAGAVAGALLGARALAVAPTVLGPGARPESWVELVVVTAGGLAAWWATLGSAVGLAVVAAARRGVRWRAGEAAVHRLAPRLVRRLVRAGVGGGVGAGLALAPVTATAAQAPVPGPGPDAPAATAVDLGWRPTALDDGRAAPPGSAAAAARPAAPPAAAAGTAPGTAPGTPSEVRREAARPGPGDGSVVVHRGDTLWDIAARWLGGSPTDAEVLAATLRWHEANRAVVGADPDLLLPGQVLSPPA